MATIAFASAAAGSGAGTYAAAVMMGSMIDNLLIMPTLFPADPVDGGRMGEFGVMGASEGDPVAMVFGQYAKVATQIAWISEDLTEVLHSNKAGKNNEQVGATYYTHGIAMIGYLGNTWSPGSIANLDQVFMDQKRVYADAATTIPGVTSEDAIFAWVNGNRKFVVFDTDIDANLKTTFWAKWLVGDRIDWTGWADAANNDPSDLIVDKVEYLTIPDSGAPNGIRQLPAFRMQKGKIAEYSGTSGAPTGIVGQDITATGVQGTGWADGLFQGTIATLRDGSHTTSWSIYRDEVGDANAPGWLDMAWLPLRGLNLTDFGGRVPNVEVVVSADTSLRTPQTIIGHILLQTDLQTSEYDVSAVDNSAAVLGYVVHTPIEATKALQPIMLAFDINAQERGKKLYFFDRADNVANTITVDASFAGDGSGGGIQVQETPIEQRYGEVGVSFVDFASDTYKKGMARAQYLSEGTIANRETPYRWTKLAINLDMTLNEGDAKEIAYRILAHSHADILKFKLKLPPRYLKLQENDRITFASGGVTYSALISQIDIGANFMLDIEATLDVAVEEDYSTWGD